MGRVFALPGSSWEPGMLPNHWKASLKTTDTFPRVLPVRGVCSGFPQLPLSALFNVYTSLRTWVGSLFNLSLILNAFLCYGYNLNRYGTFYRPIKYYNLESCLEVVFFTENNGRMGNHKNVGAYLAYVTVFLQDLHKIKVRKVFRNNKHSTHVLCARVLSHG